MAQDKKFSIITPLHKQGYEDLEKFVLHLKEQDYTNFEVILSFNSPDDEAQKYIASKKNPFPKTWEVKTVDAGFNPEFGRGNHSNAFNKGAELATGDYLLFLDPDIFLYPGVLRDYKDAFDAHPEVGFVYGDYDFEHGVGRVQGRPYSEYEIKCANYISGAFPVRKEAFRGWDETIQSLQDWDMWLSVVDGGATGYYIGRPCFTTTPPQAGGISSDQADNWTERYTLVRNKHGFPISNTAVTSLGAPYHATQAAIALGVDTRVYNSIFNFKPHNYKNLYLLGFYPMAWQAHMGLFYDLGDFKKEIVGNRHIIHWIGTDIYQMQHKLSWIAWQNIKSMLNDKDFSFVHLAESEFTQKELEELGVQADVVPLPVNKTYPLSPLPEEFTVGVYINNTQDMYYQSFMEEIAEAMPDVKFKFFGDRNRIAVEGNKEYVGWVDMQEFLPTISALARITLHDGLPISPIEAMQAGRNVLTSVPMPHSLEAKYIAGEPVRADVIAKIRKMSKLGLNTAASEYWHREVSPELYKERMAKYLV